MIKGVHAMFYSPKADEVRAFIRDKLGFSYTDTGGGWLNGRGDASMTMLEEYGHMVDFFTSFRWWSTEPHDELVTDGRYCLAKPGETYAIYLPRGGVVTVRLLRGRYRAEWWNAATGEKVTLRAVETIEGPWKSPDAPAPGDWALLLVREA